MQTLSIDIETYSDVNLSKCGVYKYAESPDFEILLFGYSSDGSEVTVIDLAPVSYTHLDVYKRQVLWFVVFPSYSHQFLLYQKYTQKSICCDEFLMNMP